MKLGEHVLWLVIVVLAALMQTTWMNVLSFRDVTPDIVLLITVYFGLRDGEERAMLTGLLGGLYQDVTSNAVLGHHVLCLVLVGYFVGRMSSRLITEHPAVKAAIVFGASIVQGLLFTMIAYVQDPTIRALYLVVTTVVPTAFYTTMLTPILLGLLWLSFQRRRLAGGPA